MSLLSGLKPTTAVKEESDNLGGGFGPMPSGAHDMTIDLAYLGKSEGGALSLTIHATGPNRETFRNTLWVTSGNAKGNKTTYTNKRTKEEVFLPGFSIANHICMLTAGKEIFDLEEETKTIKLYNFKQGKEAPTDVQTIPAIMGERVTLGLIKQIVDKNVKNGKGKYVPSGETREENEIDKVFQIDSGKTVTELRAKGDAEFIKAWREKWDGTTRDRSTKNVGASNGTPGAPGALGQAAISTEPNMFSQ